MSINQRVIATTLCLATASATVFGQETDVAELLRISNRSRIQSTAEKAEALRLAPLLGLTVRGQLSNGALYELMALRDGRPLYYVTHNAQAAITTGANKLYPGGGLGLSITGNGVLLGEWDGGTARATHQEFSGRLTVMDAEYPNVDHATHVAGTMIAAGVDPSAKGMSFAGSVRSYGWTDDVAEAAAEAAKGLRFSNHSYGRLAGWAFHGIWVWFGQTSVNAQQDFGFGFYDSDTAAIDNLLYNAPYYLPVKSAGNDRGEAPPSQPVSHQEWDGSQWITDTTGIHNRDGNATGYDSIPYDGVAKNLLTIGAVNDVPSYSGPGSVVMSTFSGWGPTDDGRIKPDIVGNGVELYSSVGTANNAYGIFSGTSMSAPNVTGTLGLLLKRWRDTHTGDPRAATWKALAIHTAKECGTSAGPDYRFGWGLMNAVGANDVITRDVAQPSAIAEYILGNGTANTFVFHNVGGAARSTIAWTDKAGPAAANVLNSPILRLVNDLDIRIAGPMGGTVTTYKPWVLNPGTPAAAATTGDNFRDNVEQISATLPEGWYKLTVTHKGALTAPPTQAYSLIITGADRFMFLGTLTLSVASVVGCQDLTGTLTITQPAPKGGFPVQMVSNNISASPPGIVTIPEGQTSVQFPIHTSTVTVDTPVVLTAKMLPALRTANLTLKPGGLATFTLDPTSVVGGTSGKGIVTISALAPVGGTVITIADTSSKSSAPKTVTIPEGKNKIAFKITTQVVTSKIVSRFTASMGGVAITKSLAITP